VDIDADYCLGEISQTPALGETIIALLDDIEEGMGSTVIATSGLDGEIAACAETALRIALMNRSDSCAVTAIAQSPQPYTNPAASNSDWVRHKTR